VAPAESEVAADRLLADVRGVCLTLPRVTERVSRGRPPFFVGSRWFAAFLADHHGDGRLALWYAAPAGVQGELLELEPDRFFHPPYVGHRGWVRVLLDTLTPHELRAGCEAAWACSAPAAALAERSSAGLVGPADQAATRGWTTPVSRSDSVHSCLASSASLAAALRPTRVGKPRISPEPSGPT